MDKIKMLKDYPDMLLRAGWVIEAPSDQASHFVESGFAEYISAPKSETSDEQGGQVEGDKGKEKTGELADDFPAKDLLLSNGISTYEELTQNLAGLNEAEALEYLEQFEGIGKATAKKIYAAAPKPE